MLTMQSQIARVSMLSLFALLLSACWNKQDAGVELPSASGQHVDGAYYLDDRPPEAEEYKHNIAQIPNAVPRAEPLSRTGNKPYTALGQKFYPLSTASGYVETGHASWYGMRYHGNRTSSGEPYDIWKMTAAHPTLPLPSYVEVTNLDNGRKVIVRVNDRGPFLRGRIIDLSYVAARKLGVVEKGIGRVQVRALNPSNYVASGSEAAPSTPVQNSLKFYLQFGAFGMIDNAVRLRQRLQRLEYAVYPASQQELLTKGSPYRVLVGPYTDAKLAYEDRQKLQQLFRQEVHLISDY